MSHTHTRTLHTHTSPDYPAPVQATPSPLASAPVQENEIHPCKQCGRDMGYEYFLGPVCGRCCKHNHRRVMGR